MAFTASAVWEVRTGGHDTNNGGGFDPGSCTLATDLAATVANTASPVVTSATYNFVSGDVGAWVYIASGTNWTAGWYQIASVASNAATLSAAIGAAVLTNGIANTALGCATTASPTSGSWTVDYSQQDAAQINYDGSTNSLVIDGTLNTKATATPAFGVNLIGNIISITAGSGFTVQRIQARSISSAAITFDKSLGTLGSTGGTGKLGGGLATPGKAGGLFLQSNRVYVKSGTYSISGSSNTAGGPFRPNVGGLVAAPCMIVGYQTNRTDLGTKPIFQAAANSLTLVGYWYDFWIYDNLEVQGNGHTAINGIQSDGASCWVKRCKANGTTNNGIIGPYANGGGIISCEATGCSGNYGISDTSVSAVIMDCVAHDNSTNGFVTGGSKVIRCISINNSGVSGWGFDVGSSYGVLINCTAYNNAQGGFYAIAEFSRLENCVAEGNTGYGFQSTSGSSTTTLINCAGYNNSLGNYDASKFLEVLGFVAYTATAFTSAAGGDFSLNTTADGGALLRAVGFPASFPGLSTNNYLDIGAAQHPNPTITYAAASDVRNLVNRGDGTLGTLIVPGAASGSATLAKESGANARGGSGTCAKLTATSASVWGYWDFYIPVTASTAFTVSFYHMVASGFNGLLKVTIYDTDDATPLLSSQSVSLTDDSAYHQHTCTQETPTATGFCRVRVEIEKGAAAAAAIYFDDWDQV